MINLYNNSITSEKFSNALLISLLLHPQLLMNFLVYIAFFWMSCKWNNTTCDLLSLASFPYCNELRLSLINQSVIYSFLSMSTIPLCGCTSLFVHSPVVGYWVISSFEWFMTKVTINNLCINFCVNISFNFSWGKYLGLGFLGHIVSKCLILS